MTGGHLNPLDLKLNDILGDSDDTPLSEPTQTNDNIPTSPTPDPASDTPVPTGDESTPPTPDTSEPVVDDSAERFTANQIAKEETPPADEPATPPATLDPEAKYIVDNLPDITTRIMDKDGNVQEVNVKSYTQLPDDVQFATKRDELAFMNALTAQENKASQLQNDYRQEQQQTQVNDFETRENAAINEDLTKLQTEDKLPKLLDPSDPKFADDPATKQVQEVLDFMNEKNTQYLDRYNKGSAYKHIGFEEAYEMMPKTQETNTQTQRQTREDNERQNKAGRVGGNTGTEAQSNARKPTVRQGATLDSIVERIENEW